MKRPGALSVLAQERDTADFMRSSYLLGYNVLQALLWTLGVGLTVWTVASTASFEHVYAAAAPVLKFAQLLALLETVHAAAGLVRGSPAMAFLQWFGRANVLLLIADYIPEVQSQWWVASTFTAWGLADMIRYPFYACSLVNKPQPLLTWLRYSAFIVLYPWGMFLGEWPLVYAALPYIKERKLHSVDMPNAWNFAFSYYYFCVVSLAVIMPGGLLNLYLYMLAAAAALS